MLYRPFQDRLLSALGMGNMRLPVRAYGRSQRIDQPKAQEIIDYAMEHGVNYYDTAYVYHNGQSERFLGTAFAGYPREKYHLATKFLLQANPDFRYVFQDQLERLQTDFIDFYLLHAISDRTVSRYLTGGCLEYFDEQKRLGKIRALGFSFHGSVETLEKVVAARKWDFAQIQLNYYDWAYDIAKQEYEILVREGVPIMVMEPVRGGKLAALPEEAERLLKSVHPDWSVASWAFRWLRGLPNIQVVLSGMSTLDQIQENVELFGDDTALTKEEEAVLFRACELFRKEIHIPCTACRYCCDGCPAKINIPVYLDYMNRYLINGRWELQGVKSAASKGKPKDCIACGACTEHCPQNIPVSEHLQRLAQLIR